MAILESSYPDPSRNRRTRVGSWASFTGVAIPVLPEGCVGIRVFSDNSICTLVSQSRSRLPSLSPIFPKESQSLPRKADIDWASSHFQRCFTLSSSQLLYVVSFVFWVWFSLASRLSIFLTRGFLDPILTLSRENDEGKGGRKLERSHLGFPVCVSVRASGKLVVFSSGESGCLGECVGWKRVKGVGWLSKWMLMGKLVIGMQIGKLSFGDLSQEDPAVDCPSWGWGILQ